MRTTRALLAGATITVALALGACTGSTGGRPSTSGALSPSTSAGASSSTARPSSATPTSPTPRSSSTAPSTPASSSRPSSSPPPAGPAARALAAMTLAQRVGQLLMVDCPSTGVSSAALAAIRDEHVGSIILDGNSYLSVGQTAAITGQLQQAAPRSVKLFIATDQEGGLVQRLRGPGFSTVPSAVTQGTWDPGALRSAAAGWGRQLRAAGVEVDLAPVLDTVPPGGAPNPPIGDLDREYGHTPAVVSAHGVAVARGLADAGVDATAKHFPGLGRVSGNTDTTAGVTDTVTTRSDPYLAPYAAAVRAGVPFVMMSTAIYSRIDPGHPAAFSPTIVTGLLRDRLGFRGVVISDDLGAAVQVSGLAPGARAVAFVAAGGDIALTVAPATVAPMVAALVARARQDPAFRGKVDAAALTVLRAKAAAGLLH